MIEGLATWTLDQALDPASRDGPPVASRCGAIRTSDVSARTTLLVARFRYHLRSASSAEDGARSFAKRSRRSRAPVPPPPPTGFHRRRANGCLPPAPEGNLLLTAVEQQLGLLLPALPELQAALEAVAHARAETQLGAHERCARRRASEGPGGHRAGAAGGPPRRLCPPASAPGARARLTWPAPTRSSRPSAPRAGCCRRTSFSAFSTRVRRLPAPGPKTTDSRPANA